MEIIITRRVESRARALQEREHNMTKLHNASRRVITLLCALKNTALWRTRSDGRVGSDVMSL